MTLRFILTSLMLSACGPQPTALPTPPGDRTILTPVDCVDPTDLGTLQWYAIDDCPYVTFDCGPDGAAFGDACGCGCVAVVDDDCVDPSAETTTEWMPLEDCEAWLPNCGPDGEFFIDACGCGCEETCS